MFEESIRVETAKLFAFQAFGLSPEIEKIWNENCKTFLPDYGNRTYGILQFPRPLFSIFLIYEMSYDSWHSYLVEFFLEDTRLHLKNFFQC